MKNELIFYDYMIYLPIVLLLTLVVSKTLFKNGKIFLMDIFNGREEIAQSTNRLLEVGFYLLNLGFALLIMEIYDYGNPDISKQEVMEALSSKIGGFSIYLGLMLFFNLFLFFRGKKKAKDNRIRAAQMGFLTESKNTETAKS